MRRALLPAWTGLLAAVLVLGVTAPVEAAPKRRGIGAWDVRRRRPDHGHRATATGTATGCRSTAPRAPPGRA